MRIVIDITGEPGEVHLEPGAGGGEGQVRDADVADGGGGPVLGASFTEHGDVAVITDGGPPPAWLLDVVAAAEAAPTGVARGAGEPDAAAADAGAGPGPGALSHDD